MTHTIEDRHLPDACRFPVGGAPAHQCVSSRCCHTINIQPAEITPKRVCSHGGNTAGLVCTKPELWLGLGLLLENGCVPHTKIDTKIVARECCYCPVNPTPAFFLIIPRLILMVWCLLYCTSCCAAISPSGAYTTTSWLDSVRRRLQGWRV